MRESTRVHETRFTLGTRHGLPRETSRRRKISILAVTLLSCVALLPASARPQGNRTSALGGGMARSAEETPIDLEIGRRDYTLYCSSCHGAKGDGDGLLAKALDPPPTRLADPAALASSSDADLYEIIEKGGAAVGRSEGMAAWGNTLAPPQIANLVAFIRTLAASPPRPNEAD